VRSSAALPTSGYTPLFSLKGKQPPRVHLEKAERYAAVWPHPAALARASAFINAAISEIITTVRQRRKSLLEAWHEHFDR
jgi:hypothetical protein